MSTENYDYDLNTRLSKIEAKLEQISQILGLSERVSQLEENLMLVTDVQRYSKLQELLAAAKWQEADAETFNVLLDVAQRQDLESFTPEDVSKYPCHSLKVIDKLWIKYSKGRFGFTVQKRIYESVGGGGAYDRKVMDKYGDIVGWRVNNKWQEYDHLNFTLEAPVGCHPSGWWYSPFGGIIVNQFLSRLVSCNF
ncbi:MAG: GUN4 domain-containing protein [Microcoleaceae cyanobacterium MO_207.B10]|nr:GUN4 domain-containing protein [Microcoleaceae cyanobacterium MO_207.B10]